MTQTNRHGPVSGGAWLPTRVEVGISPAAKDDIDEEESMIGAQDM